MTNENITISIPADLLDEIDSERGLVPRSAYITDILRKRKLMRDGKCQRKK